MICFLRDADFVTKSRSSRDCDRNGTDLSDEDILLWERLLRSARPEDTEEVEECVSWGAGGGCVVRAREERRGDMLELREPQANGLSQT